MGPGQFIVIIGFGMVGIVPSLVGMEPILIIHCNTAPICLKGSRRII